MSIAVKYGAPAYVERYLSPVDGLGCGKHSKDLGCLCDVDLSDRAPVPLRRAPRTFLAVETVEDLLSAAADVWVRYDILNERKRRVFPGSVENISDDQLVIICEMVRAGKTRAQVAEALGFNLSSDILAFARRANDLSQRRANVVGGVVSEAPASRLVELGDAGMSASDISKVLFEETGMLHDQAVVRRRYKRSTGRALKKTADNRPSLFPKQRIRELAAEGLSPREIRKALADEGIMTYTHSIRRYLDTREGRVATNAS